MVCPFQHEAIDNGKTIVSQRSGWTLVEMLVVLVILVALAAMVVPLFGGLEIQTASGEKTPQHIATEATLRQIRNVIMGTPNRPGVWADVGQRPQFFPLTIATLFAEAPPYPGLSAFDPTTRIGWRGPYVAEATDRDAFGNPTLIDAWGQEIVIQVDFDGSGDVSSTEARYARLVSAGPDGQVDTPDDAANMVPGSNSATQLTLAECNDDIVLFLRLPDTRL